MIQNVTFERTIYQGAPQRFEAGTGNIADAVGLGAAIDYLDRIGMPNISRHEHALLEQATNELIRIPGLHIIGAAKEKAGVLSFALEGFRKEEVGDYLNKQGIAVRSGHHCAQPILLRLAMKALCACRWLSTIHTRISTGWSRHSGTCALGVFQSPERIFCWLSCIHKLCASFRFARKHRAVSHCSSH